MYYEPGIKKIQFITSELIDEEVDKWIIENSQLDGDSEPSFMSHANLYSLIKTFKPDEDEVREIFKSEYDFYVENDLSTEHSITDETREVFYSKIDRFLEG